MKTNIHLPDVVGKGYKDFWEFKGRYRVIKGSRASKKSKTIALNTIVKMMQYPKANTLVVRKVFGTLKDSCYTELKWAINRLGVTAFWKCRESPLEIIYIPTGQKIYFRGLDDSQKISSITVEVGSLCFLWLEEAYEITNESDFNMIDEAVRGYIEPPLYKQITLSFNPWNERHWLKKRFFDIQSNPEILAKTTNYLCNEFLDAADKKMFDMMRLTNPRRYKVAGLGDWGIAEGLIYENWEEQKFDLETVKKIAGIKAVFGLDFGYTNDPTALCAGLLDLTAKVLYVFDELYEKALTNKQIFTRVQAKGYIKERIRADSAEPKSIDELRELGMQNARAARKGRDSVNNGIQFIQGLKIIVHPRCVNFITEISNYTWERNSFGEKLNMPIDDFNHLMDAMRYAVEDHIVGDTFSFS